ncbi:STAS domain-containing protein [Nocardioides marmoribigeumensis]|jgi:anti-anti-sigma factor|uniref:Anti-anti-sigma factor n=1 Tax=Nocardioides marmoribigeumensis TaxID=433649 RepID=A0ABU2BZH1_9ACTN|nr:STAS domain-containing protein [Nocardioides marmoribigeumensis]MDR7363777.1 anti-anti-sigma factor [Nocardioides marmoribigeumensis]
MAEIRTFQHPLVPFAVSSDMHDGHLALDLSGELDLACTDALDRDGHEDDLSVSDVTVDMSHLEFIDTAGVRALVEVKNRHLDRGRSVQMVNPVTLVRKVVGLYGRADLLAG